MGKNMPLKLSCKAGRGDALNDERNLEAAASAIKKVGKHLQMTICYSTTQEGRMGGPIYDLEIEW